MIDPTTIVKTYLGTNAALTALIGTRQWGGRSVPVTRYRPEQGGALVYRARGGPPPTDEFSKLLRVSYQFKCYGATEVAANAVNGALFDALEGAAYGAMIHAGLEVAGQELRERAMEPNDWPYVLVFYLLHFRNT